MKKIDKKVEDAKVVEEAKADVAKIVEQAKPSNIEELWMAIDLRFNAIETMLKEKIASAPKGRGPSSTRSMTEADAERIMVGDLKDASIKTCLTTLGLSYGQIYSARNGYTFKTQYAKREAAAKK